MNRKMIFDAVRHMLGRGFRHSEVRALDQAIDRALDLPSDDGPVGAGETEVEFFPQDRAPCAPSCRISPAGIQLIQQFEACARLRPDGLYEAYPDPGTGGAPWTIGWGSTGAGIGPQTVWTKEQCDRRFEADLVRYASEVSAAIGNAPTTQHQFDALVSFHYNTGAIRRATLTRLHIDGQFDRAAQEFARWRYAGGQILRGLVRRRRAEARLYRMQK